MIDWCPELRLLELTCRTPSLPLTRLSAQDVYEDANWLQILCLSWNELRHAPIVVVSQLIFVIKPTQTQKKNLMGFWWILLDFCGFW